MSKGLKVESLLKVACEGIEKAYKESTSNFRSLVKTFESLEGLKTLLELLDKHGAVIIELASISEVLAILRSSILVDDQIAIEELEVGQEILEHSMHRLSFLDAYAEFDPLLNASEVHDLLVVKPDLNARSLADDSETMPRAFDGRDVLSNMSSYQAAGLVRRMAVADVQLIGVRCGIGCIQSSSQKESAIAAGGQMKVAAKFVIIQIEGSQQEALFSTVDNNRIVFHMPVRNRRNVPAKE